MSINRIFSIQETIIFDNFGIDLIESLKIAKKIEQALQQLNLKVPDEVKYIEEIDIWDDNYFLVYKGVTDSGQKVKIGKVLRKLFPDKTDKEIERIYYKLIETMKKNEYVNKIKNYDFKYYNGHQIYEQYKSFSGTSLATCVNKYLHLFNEEMLKFYIINPDISLLIITYKDDSEKVARALVWRNTSLRVPYIDRIYTIFEKNDYKAMKNMYNVIVAYANEKGYAYRALEGDRNVEGSDSSATDCKVYLNSKEVTKPIFYKVPKEIWSQLKYMPFMDTFCYGTDNGLLSNSYNAIKWKHYLKDEQGFIELNKSY